MLTKRVIPCLDVSHGRVVKGVKFQGLRDAGDPVELALAYGEQGADEVVVLDISATVEERSHQLDVVRAIRERFALPLTVGGGIRTVEDAAWFLEAGADKVAVNTAAVARPELLSELATRFGFQCVVLAIDVRALAETPGDDTTSAEFPAYRVVVRAGRDALALDAIAWAKQATALGAGEILLTSWDRDGTRQGYDTALIRAVANAVSVPIIASGGASSVDHMVEAFEAGADAALAASIFHDRETTVQAVKQALAAAGVEVRL